MNNEDNLDSDPFKNIREVSRDLSKQVKGIMEFNNPFEDVMKFKSPFEDVMKFKSPFEDVMKFKSPFEDVMKFKSSFSDIFKDLNIISEKLKDFIEEKYNSHKNVVIELKKFGWELCKDIDEDLIDFINSLIIKKQDLTKEDYINSIDDIMSESIDEISEKIKDRTIELWVNRKEIIKNAYEAHQSGLYNLSVPVFLNQIDGIGKEIFNLSDQENFYSKKSGKPLVKNKIKEISDGLELDKKSFIYLAYLYPFELLSCSMVNTQEIEKKIEEDYIYSGFNRHAVIHGVSTSYGNKLNSNKCLSMLGLLCDIQDFLSTK